MNRKTMRIIFAIIFLGLFQTVLLSAQDVATGKVPTLSDKERALSGKYDQLEAILLRMAEVNATTDPRRATLLKKVIAESKDRLISLRFEEIAAILQRSRFSQAIDMQIGLEKDLAELLKLLESENRAKLRESEKEKLKEVLREIEELILQQRSLKGRTTETENLKPVAQEQEKINDKTKNLAQKMGDLPEIGPPPQEKKQSLSDSPNENSEKGKENQEESESSESNTEKSEENSQEKLSPTQQAMRQAQKRMKQAQEQLEKMEKKGAVEDQEEAIAELQKARAELERLLRQLREEELMQTLQYLDARLRKMLQLEKAIRSQTEQLEKQQSQPETENGSPRQIQILASRLGVDQSKVIEDADAALMLLREDGTAQAMKESLEQTRFDMLEVEERLRRADVGSITQSIEDTIIESLQEMIDAVAQAKKESQERSQRDQNQPPGSQAAQDEQNLIDQLSELRMIRTMQRRINERTARYEELLREGKSDIAVLEKNVDELARQQLRIRQILRDMSLGRNR